MSKQRKDLTAAEKLALARRELAHAQGAMAECLGMRQALDNRLVELNRQVKQLTKAIERAMETDKEPKLVIAKDLPRIRRPRT